MLPHDPDAATPPKPGVAFNVRPIGVVHSPRRHAARVLGTLERWAVEIFPSFSDVLGGLQAGTEVWLLTFHIEPDSARLPAGKGGEADASEASAPSAAHPVSPIRFTQVKLLDREGGSLQVEGPCIEDGTPVLDIRSVLCPLANSRTFT